MLTTDYGQQTFTFHNLEGRLNSALERLEFTMQLYAHGVRIVDLTDE